METIIDVIKKGDRFLCIKDVVMDYDHNEITYYQGFNYVSEFDNCITNVNNNKNHHWTHDRLNYFRRINERGELLESYNSEIDIYWGIEKL